MNQNLEFSIHFLLSGIAENAQMLSSDDYAFFLLAKNQFSQHLLPDTALQRLEKMECSILSQTIED